MMICLSLVVLFVAGGVAASDGEVVFSTLERYLGSDGDGGAFVGSASDGVRIALYGVDSPAHAASYILVIDGSTALTKGTSQTVISNPLDWLKGGAADFVALCGDRVAIVKEGSGFMTFSVDSFAASTTEWRLWETAEAEWPVSHAAYLPESCDAFPGDLVVVEAFDRAALVSNVRVTEGASVCQVDVGNGLQWATVDGVALSRKKSAAAYLKSTSARDEANNLEELFAEIATDFVKRCKRWVPQDAANMATALSSTETRSRASTSAHMEQGARGARNFWPDGVVTKVLH